MAVTDKIPRNFKVQALKCHWLEFLYFTISLTVLIASYVAYKQLHNKINAYSYLQLYEYVFSDSRD